MFTQTHGFSSPDCTLTQQGDCWVTWRLFHSLRNCQTGSHGGHSVSKSPWPCGRAAGASVNCNCPSDSLCVHTCAHGGERGVVIHRSGPPPFRLSLEKPVSSSCVDITGAIVSVRVRDQACSGKGRRPRGLPHSALTSGGQKEACSLIRTTGVVQTGEIERQRFEVAWGWGVGGRIEE